METMAVLLIIMLVIIMIGWYDLSKVIYGYKELKNEQLRIRQQLDMLESILRVAKNDFSRQQMEIKTQLNKIEVELHLKELLALIDDLDNNLKELKKQSYDYMNNI